MLVQNIRVLQFGTMMNFLFYDENGSNELIRMLVKRYPAPTSYGIFSVVGVFFQCWVSSVAFCGWVVGVFFPVTGFTNMYKTKTGVIMCSFSLTLTCHNRYFMGLLC